MGIIRRCFSGVSKRTRAANRELKDFTKARGDVNNIRRLNRMKMRIGEKLLDDNSLTFTEAMANADGKVEALQDYSQSRPYLKNLAHYEEEGTVSGSPQRAMTEDRRAVNKDSDAVLSQCTDGLTQAGKKNTEASNHVKGVIDMHEHHELGLRDPILADTFEELIEQDQLGLSDGKLT